MIGNRGGKGGAKPGVTRKGSPNKATSNRSRGIVVSGTAAKRGRPPGSKDINPKDVSLVTAAAQKWIPTAIDRLAQLAGLMPDPASPGKFLPGATSEPAQIAAISLLWDRAYGKVTLPMRHSVDEGLEALLDRIGGV